MFNITESNAARYFRCADRASRLLSEGYKIVEGRCVMPNTPGAAFLFSVVSPALNAYSVNLAEVTCNCPDFEKNGDFCKHLIFVAETEKDNAEMWNAICGEVDARAELQAA